VSRDAAGRWFVSILVEDPTVTPLPESAGQIDLDAGLPALVIFSDGEKVTKAGMKSVTGRGWPRSPGPKRCRFPSASGPVLPAEASTIGT
jgi:hypothetical protein